MYDKAYARVIEYTSAKNDKELMEFNKTMKMDNNDLQNLLEKTNKLQLAINQHGAKLPSQLVE